MPSNPKARKTRRKSTSVDPVTQFANDVVAGSVVAGPLVRLAAARHLRDIQEQEKRGIVWKPNVAIHEIGFFPTVLRLNGGEFEGQPFNLEPFQKFIVGSLFGWFGTDGYRRFRVAYVEMGKGNGKSPMAAGIGLKMEVADDEPRAEVYAAATKKDQAMILFRDAVAMRDQSPALRTRLQKYGGAAPWNLHDQRTGSFFRAIASEDSQSGPRPHCGLIDELHEHPDATMVDMMRAGTKGRRQALIFEITNSGYDRNSVCYAHHEYSERILKNLVDDESWFAFVCSLDPGDDWRDESVWQKANPNLGVSITHKYLREQVREATGMPSKQSIVRRLNFCEWVGSDEPWIDEDKWLACEHYLNLADYKGRPAFGGLDLSGKNDLSSLVLEFPTDEGGYDAVPIFWTPQEGLRDREDRDRVPYTQWVRESHISTTPGRSIDYGFIAQRIAELRGLVDLKAITFDRWRIDDLLRELDDLGIDCEIVPLGEESKGSPDLVLIPHGQGFKDMSPAVEAIETVILNGQYRIAKNPAMTMCALNAVCSIDPAGSRKFDKRPGKSTGRIDGMVAAAMAHRCASSAPEVKPSIYATRGMLNL